jgi:cytochrome P450
VSRQKNIGGLLWPISVVACYNLAFRYEELPAEERGLEAKGPGDAVHPGLALMNGGHATAPADIDIVTPRSKPSLLTGRRLPALAAQLGAWFASWSKCAIRLGNIVVVIRHEDVRQILERDLDFRIAPINAKRINEVNGPFILGMDRGDTLDRERALLYQAIEKVDLAAIRESVARTAASQIATTAGNTIDVVSAYARPVAAATAVALFGVQGPGPQALMDVARAIFAHTFLNLTDDETIRARAIRASVMMHEWIAGEIERRLAAPDPGSDLMGQLIRLQPAGSVDTDLVRRTIGGMLVGSIDTTTTSVAKIIAVLGSDKALAAAVARDVDTPELLRGWCWEALRRWPHNPILLREAAGATTLNGQEIKAGARIFAWTQAAMLDSAAFPDPRRLRPDRPTAGYLHFGGELHVCAGRSVNAFQIPMLVGALVRRGMASVGKVAWAGPFPDQLVVELAP